MREADIDIRLMDYYLSELTNYKVDDITHIPKDSSTTQGNLVDNTADDSTEAN